MYEMGVDIKVASNIEHKKDTPNARHRYTNSKLLIVYLFELSVLAEE